MFWLRKNDNVKKKDCIWCYAFGECKKHSKNIWKTKKCNHRPKSIITIKRAIIKLERSEDIHEKMYSAHALRWAIQWWKK